MQFNTEPKDMTDHPETEIQFIRRIIAMLLTLAGIAERAAGYPYPIRAFLLWVLRRAEKAAQDFVDIEDLWAGAAHGNASDDALTLADSLRELAAFLEDDLRNESLFQGWWRNGAALESGEPKILVIAIIAAIVHVSHPCRFPTLWHFAPIPRLDSS